MHRPLTRLLLAGAASLAAVACLTGPDAGALTGRDVKVLGGSVAAPGQFLWMVALVEPRAKNAADGQFCGGMLIAPRVVLTAAHCVEGVTAAEMQAVVGRTRLSQGADGQRLAVSRVVRHPDYDEDELTNDLALLQLATPAQVAPIVLDGPADSSSERPGRSVLVAGWGATSEGGRSSDDLRYVRLRIRSGSRCSDVYGTVSATRTVCAGSGRSGEDSCQGDSGGPLVRGDGEAVRLVGIVSYGRGCGHRGVPGVYTRVAAFSAFITEQSAFLNGDAPAPPPRVNPPAVRVERVGCGTKTCTVFLRVSGRAPAGGIVLNILRARRGSRRGVDRFVFAKRVSPTRYVAHDDLPFGRLTLYAIPLNAAQDDLDGDGDVTSIEIVPA